MRCLKQRKKGKKGRKEGRKQGKEEGKEERKEERKERRKEERKETKEEKKEGSDPYDAWPSLTLFTLDMDIGGSAPVCGFFLFPPIFPDSLRWGLTLIDGDLSP